MFFGGGPKNTAQVYLCILFACGVYSVDIYVVVLSGKFHLMFLRLSKKRVVEICVFLGGGPKNIARAKGAAVKG